MNKLSKKPRNENMYKAILTLRDVDECMKFFDDLCTVSESGRDRRFQRHDQPRQPFAAVWRRRL